jgi:predicted O-methyltransferase YrrM
MSNWTKQEELDQLRSWSRGRVLELGTWTGTSAKAWLQGKCEHLTCVDHFKGQPGNYSYMPACETEIGREAIKNELYANLSDFAGRWNLIEGQTSLVLPTLPLESFDVVFIDADHREGPVMRDIKAALTLVKPGGLICGHDFFEIGVQSAVRASFRQFIVGPVCLWSVHKACPSKA